MKTRKTLVILLIVILHLLLIDAGVWRGCSLYSPIQGKDFLLLSGHNILAWNHTTWASVGAVDSSLVPTSNEGLAAEFWVRFKASPDTSDYAAVLLVNRVPAHADSSFWDVQVQFPERRLRFNWRGQRAVEGRTRLEANVWHHVVAQFGAHGGCRWCGRLSLIVNGAQDHVWGYVDDPATVTPRVYDIAMLHGHPGERASSSSSSSRRKGSKGGGVKQHAHTPVWDAEFAAVSDVRLWSSELSLVEVRRLAARGLPAVADMSGAFSPSAHYSSYDDEDGGGDQRNHQPRAPPVSLPLLTGRRPPGSGAESSSSSMTLLQQRIADVRLCDDDPFVRPTNGSPNGSHAVAVGSHDIPAAAATSVEVEGGIRIMPSGAESGLNGEQRQKKKRRPHRSAITNAAKREELAPDVVEEDGNDAPHLLDRLGPLAPPLPGITHRPAPAFTWHSMMMGEEQVEVEIDLEAEAAAERRREAEQAKKREKLAMMQKKKKKKKEKKKEKQQLTQGEAEHDGDIEDEEHRRGEDELKVGSDGRESNQSEESESLEEDGVGQTTLPKGTERRLETRPWNLLVTHVSRSIGGGYFREERIAAALSALQAGGRAAGSCDALGLVSHLTRAAPVNFGELWSIEDGHPPESNEDKGNDDGGGGENRTADRHEDDERPQVEELASIKQHHPWAAQKTGVSMLAPQRQKTSPPAAAAAAKSATEASKKESAKERHSSIHVVPPPLTKPSQHHRSQATVSMVVWAEDLRDEQRNDADLGHVEALWRALQTSDAFAPLHRSLPSWYDFGEHDDSGGDDDSDDDDDDSDDDSDDDEYNSDEQSWEKGGGGGRRRRSAMASAAVHSVVEGLLEGTADAAAQKKMTRKKLSAMAVKRGMGWKDSEGKGGVGSALLSMSRNHGQAFPALPPAKKAKKVPSGGGAQGGGHGGGAQGENKILAELVLVTTGVEGGVNGQAKPQTLSLAAAQRAAWLRRRLRRSDHGVISLRVHHTGGGGGSSPSSVDAPSAGRAAAAAAAAADAATTTRCFSEVANWAAVLCSGELIVFLRPNVLPLTGWLSEMLRVYHHHGEDTPGQVAGNHGLSSSEERDRGKDEEEEEKEKEEKRDAKRSDDFSSSSVRAGSHRQPRIVGSVVLYPTGKVFHAGFEYHATPLANPADVKALRGLSASPSLNSQSSALLPHHRLRGYSPNDLRLIFDDVADSVSGTSFTNSSGSGSSSSGGGGSGSSGSGTGNGGGGGGLDASVPPRLFSTAALGVSRNSMLVSKSDFFDLDGGFSEDMSPGFEDADLSLRLLRRLSATSSSSASPSTSRRRHQDAPPLHHHGGFFATTHHGHGHGHGGVLVAVRSRVVSVNPEALPDLEDAAAASALGLASPGAAFAFGHDHDRLSGARVRFFTAWQRWLERSAFLDLLFSPPAAVPHGGGGRSSLFSQRNRRKKGRDSNNEGDSNDDEGDSNDDGSRGGDGEEDEDDGGEEGENRKKRKEAVRSRGVGPRLSWVLHCGGSQGYEAASILTALEARVPTKAIVRRYGECEHTDTIRGMPGAFRDAFDRAAVRRFVGPYVRPEKSYSSLDAAAKRGCCGRSRCAQRTAQSRGAASEETSRGANETISLSSQTIRQCDELTARCDDDGDDDDGEEDDEWNDGKRERIPTGQQAFSAQELLALATGETTNEALKESRAREEAGRSRKHRRLLRDLEAAKIAAWRRDAASSDMSCDDDDDDDDTSCDDDDDDTSCDDDDDDGTSCDDDDDDCALPPPCWNSSPRPSSNRRTREASSNALGAGTIAVYARDWRELGRWVPRDAAFVVGRYMFEAADLPADWAAHCNALDEVWVPSQWQKERFAASGVHAAKIFVLPEALDVFQFDPALFRQTPSSPPPRPRRGRGDADADAWSFANANSSSGKSGGLSVSGGVDALPWPGTQGGALAPLPFTGTVLDGLSAGDPARPMVFLSVFKLEDRKGWRELVKAFMIEFEGHSRGATLKKDRDRVVLVLRTYLHVEGSGFSNDKAKVLSKIQRYLSNTIGYHPDSSSRHWPTLEVVTEHLPSRLMPALYAAADAFVLPTHGEGWGLPTMEAMAMGLPVITTNWGGSTEFVTDDTGYLLDIDGVVGTQQTLDSPYRGNRWAKPSARHLRRLLRKVYNDWEAEGAAAAAAASAAAASAAVKASSALGDGVSAALLKDAVRTAMGVGRNGRPYAPYGFKSPGVGRFVWPGLSESAAKGRRAREHIVTHYRPEVVADQYAARLNAIQELIDYRNQFAGDRNRMPRTDEDGDEKQRQKDRSGLENDDDDDDDDDNDDNDDNDDDDDDDDEKALEHDEYHGDAVLGRLDSGWSLSDSYRQCAATRRPFPLRKLFQAPGNLTVRSERQGKHASSDKAEEDDDMDEGGTLLRSRRRNLCHIAVLSTYVPRECGIAIYTERLVEGLRRACRLWQQQQQQQQQRGEEEEERRRGGAEGGAFRDGAVGDGSVRIEVIPVRHKNMALSEYDASTVKVGIREWELGDYQAAADYVNEEAFGLVLLQYEFGIWPLAHVLCFAKSIRTRLITTIHTVSRTYSMEDYHAYVQQLALISHRVTVMTELMRWTLDSFHGVPPHRVAVIPHGVPDINPLRRRSQGTPRQPIFPGRPVIMTNGLMHQYKGIEYMLEAMPAVLEHHPKAVYLIDGKPHPGGWGVQGYYSGLKKKASELGLVQRGAVVFNNEFSGYDALLMKLEAAAVYVNPYTDVTQSVSGTVAMALAAGAAVVSTPYPYALEALAGDVGVFVPFRDSDALARAITALLSDPTRIVQHNRRAWAYARNMTWQLVAQQHLDVASAMR